MSIPAPLVGARQGGGSRRPFRLAVRARQNSEVWRDPPPQSSPTRGRRRTLAADHRPSPDSSARRRPGGAAPPSNAGFDVARPLRSNPPSGSGGARGGERTRPGARVPSRPGRLPARLRRLAARRPSARTRSAGFTLAAIAIPEQMATARLAGLPPQAGFVALIAGAIGFALFGASRRLSVGADSTIAPIFAGTLGAVASDRPRLRRPRRRAGASQSGSILVDRRPAAVRLHRRSAVDSGHDRLSRRHRRPYRRLAGARRAGPRRGPGPLRHAGGGAHRAAWLRRISGRLASASAVVALVAACEAISPRIPGALIAVAGATAASSRARARSEGRRAARRHFRRRADALRRRP